MNYARFVTLALSCALVGAGCNSGTTTDDAGTDSGSTPDLGTDSAVGTDAGTDSGSDTDLGTDSGTDAGMVDAGGPYDCLGATLPTTAPAMITVSGMSVDQLLTGPAPLGGVLVEAFGPTGTTPVTMMTSDSGGLFTLTLPTGGMPVDGYLRATKAGHKDTYVYSAVPMAADTSNALAILITPTVFGLLAGGAGQMDTNGFIALKVEDCLGNPITDAVVTTTPAAGAIWYNSSGLPSGAATRTDVDGIAYAFNVPPGNVMVDATVSGMTLRGHMLNARAGAFTTTVIAP